MSGLRRPTTASGRSTSVRCCWDASTRARQECAESTREATGHRAMDVAEIAARFPQAPTAPTTATSWRKITQDCYPCPRSKLSPISPAVQRICPLHWPAQHLDQEQILRRCAPQDVRDGLPLRDQSVSNTL